MSEVWHSLKKSLNCKPHSSEVHDPIRSAAEKKKKGKIDESSNARDFILNPVTHEIVLDESSGEIKIVEESRRSTKKFALMDQKNCVDCDECRHLFSKLKGSVKNKDFKDSNDPPTLTCHHGPSGKLKSLDTAEEHSISENSVMELHREDSSWNIIHQICKANYTTSQSPASQIESMLKVQNSETTFACFEEYREMVKSKAETQQNNHPRCLVDGNELLRFHGATIACSLGVNGISTLCTSNQCVLCQILRHGFSTKQELFLGALGVFTTSTSEKAIDGNGILSSNQSMLRKAVIVCRVIAGRIHNHLQEVQEIADSEFDSLVKKVSGERDIDEELFVLNPRAVLPCFVVIYKF